MQLTLWAHLRVKVQIKLADSVRTFVEFIDAGAGRLRGAAFNALHCVLKNLDGVAEKALANTEYLSESRVETCVATAVDQLLALYVLRDCPSAAPLGGPRDTSTPAKWHRHDSILEMQVTLRAWVEASSSYKAHPAHRDHVIAVKERLLGPSAASRADTSSRSVELLVQRRARAALALAVQSILSLRHSKYAPFVCAADGDTFLEDQDCGALLCGIALEQQAFRKACTPQKMIPLIELATDPVDVHLGHAPAASRVRQPCNAPGCHNLAPIALTLQTNKVAPLSETHPVFGARRKSSP